MSRHIPHGVPVYLHDYYGPNRTAKAEATNAHDFRADGLKYRAVPPLTGHEAQVAEVHDVEFPQLLDPVDDLAPTTVITEVRPCRVTKRECAARPPIMAPWPACW